MGASTTCDDWDPPAEDPVVEEEEGILDDCGSPWGTSCAFGIVVVIGGFGGDGCEGLLMLSTLLLDGAVSPLENSFFVARLWLPSMTAEKLLLSSNTFDFRTQVPVQCLNIQNDKRYSTVLVVLGRLFVPSKSFHYKMVF